jgi:hypothetical protein
VVETPEHRGIVRLDWDEKEKRWLRTAYEKTPRSGRTSDLGQTYGGEKAPSPRGDMGRVESGAKDVKGKEITGDREVFDRINAMLKERASRPDLEGPTQIEIRKGATQFLDDGRAILHLFETADVSTLVHELAHMLRRQLSPSDLAVAEKWLKVAPGGEWKRAQEEKFARGFEAYLMEGVAPSSGLRAVFAKMKQWLAELTVPPGISGA